MTILDYHVRIVVEETPPHFYREVQTDVLDNTIVDPSFPTQSVRDFVIEKVVDNVPTCVGNSPTDLTIRTNVGSVIVNDDYLVEADPNDQKFILMAIARDDGTGLLEILAFEKLTEAEQYPDTPDGKTVEKNLKEFSVVAAGTVLVEEEDFI